MNLWLKKCLNAPSNDNLVLKILDNMSDTSNSAGKNPQGFSWKLTSGGIYY